VPVAFLAIPPSSLKWLQTTVSVLLLAASLVANAGSSQPTQSSSVSNVAREENSTEPANGKMAADSDEVTEALLVNNS
jgi:hypothetical protein